MTILAAVACLVLHYYSVGLTRPAFWSNALAVPSALLSLEPNTQDDDDVVLPLRWLPIAGCLAVSVLVNDEFLYQAVVDTGSPFLTAPPEVSALLPRHKALKTTTTMEQYGETAAPMTWQQTRSVLVGGVQRIGNCQLGLVTDQLRQDTGGLFCGLIAQDDVRRTFLQQTRRLAFTVNYKQRTLTLHRRRRAPILSGNDVFDMYDLSPYGPNLHHYAVLVDTLTLQTKQGRHVTLSSSSKGSTQRPIVVVIDTGLTGCIFSDSFLLDGCLDEHKVSLADIKGVRVELDNSASTAAASPFLLTNDATYWNLACFRLPWFTDPHRHPHIVAAGATFLRYYCITVDARQRRIRLTRQGET